MAGKNKDDLELLKKFSCSTCLVVLESIEAESRLSPEMMRATKASRGELLECIRFSEENQFVERCGKNCYTMTEKGKEALRRFKDVAPLVCEPQEDKKG